MSRSNDRPHRSGREAYSYKMRKKKPNARLQTAREERGWTQQYVATQVGTTAETVGRWERGVQPPQRHFQLKLEQLFELSSSELGFSSRSHEPSSPPLWHLPSLRNPYFTGHEQTLQQLHTALHTKKAAVLTQALSGLGGIGKTQIALEYAYRHPTYRTVLWVGADSQEILFAHMVDIARKLALPLQDIHDQHQMARAIKHWLETQTGWLLILDNVEDFAILSELLPLGEAQYEGHVIVTTQAQAVGTWANCIAVDSMEQEEGAALLLRRAKKIGEQASLATAATADQDNARATTNAMEGLPLALDQAGAYIEETKSSVAEYLDLYQTRRADLLQRRGNDLHGHPQSVTTTFTLAFEKVQQLNPAAIHLLEFCAFVHPEAIPEELIVAGASHLGPLLSSLVRDPIQFREALGVLFKYSLLRRNADTKTLSIHRLVQAVLKDTMEAPLRELWAERAVRALDTACTASGKLPLPEGYMPHVLEGTKLIEQEHLQSEEAAHLLYQAGYTLRERGLYEEAKPLCLKALQIYAVVLGPVDPRAASSFLNQALLLENLGMFDTAELAYEWALMLSERALGRNHPDLIGTLNHVARMYMKREAYNLAAKYCMRAFRIYQQTQAPDSPEAASCLATVAKIFFQIGAYADAERYHLKAKTMRERLLDPEHLDVAESLEDLARLAAVLRDFSKAKQLIRRAIRIRRSVFGPDHPDTAWAFETLAIICSGTGDDLQAEKIHRRVLAIRTQKLAQHHPDIGRSHEYLAQLYERLGKKKEATYHRQQAERVCRQQIELPPGESVFLIVETWLSALRQMGKEDLGAPLVDFLEYVRASRQELDNEFPFPGDQRATEQRRNQLAKQ